MRRAYLGWIVFVGTIAIGIALVCFTKVVNAQAQSSQTLADYAPFIGHYTGEVMVETPSGPARRELDVLVQREAEGFSLEWSTDTVRPDGRIKSETYFIAFKPSPRPGYYLPTNQVQRKGQTVRIDPLDGDPQLLLCKIEGGTMTIHASQLMDDDVFEVQTYQRTLTPGGMHLKFHRVRNGAATRAIEADLKRE
jgi:hypothetical protein